MLLPSIAFDRVRAVDHVLDEFEALVVGGALLRLNNPASLRRKMLANDDDDPNEACNHGVHPAALQSNNDVRTNIDQWRHDDQRNETERSLDLLDVGIDNRDELAGIGFRHGFHGHVGDFLEEG